jgi:hypothetical protein
MVPAWFAAALLVAQQPAPSDTTAALERAQFLVGRHYAEMIRPSHARVCRGITFDDCRQGTWRCTVNTCPDNVRERRASLIVELEELAPRAGYSEWLFFQRVGFAVKHGELERAREIAGQCASADWWCQALRGFVAHWQKQGSGVAHFDSAFSVAAPALQCEWDDFSRVVPDLATAAQRSCVAGEDARRLFWWLADPLWSVDGNARYAEHLSRHVMLRISSDQVEHVAAMVPTSHPDMVARRAINAAALVWSPFSTGWPNSIGENHMTVERTWNRRLPQGGDTIVVTRSDWRQPVAYVYGGYSFAPDAARFHDPVGSSAEDWAVRWDHGEERLIPRERWHNLEHQTAVLRRGDRLLVVAAAALPQPLAALGQLDSHLALGRPADRSILLAPAVRSADGGRVHARIEADAGGYLASIEVMGDGLVGRARHGAPVPPLEGGFGVSDLVLLSPDFQERGLSIEAALLPSLRLRRDEVVGVYFEIYGVDPEEDLTVTLMSEGGQSSVLGRLTGLFRRGAGAPAALAWQEPAGGEEFARRFLVLDLRSLPAGTRRLEIGVTRADGTAVTASREIELR